MSKRNRSRSILVARMSLVVLAAAGCIIRYASVRPLPVVAATVVRSPVKAHLRDGSTVAYPHGVQVAGGALRGAGHRYDLTLHEIPLADSIPLDSVVGMESYSIDVNYPATVALSAGVTAVAVVVAAAAAVAVFGSCPTFYSDSAGAARLEAEGFSYSIAPLFEARDVDRLRATLQPDGSVRIEVRNEALETHYINQLALLEVRHDASELVLPDGAGRAVAVRDLVPARRAVDRAGHDVADLLASEDGRVTQTDSSLLARATAADVGDYIDLTFAVPHPADSIALVLRVRNSLLNTVLLYDGMLGSGARSLDWLGESMNEIGPALELGQWYGREMGLRILVLDADSTREIAHLRETGPIAWKDVAVVIAAPRADSVRLRLAFVADNWRIDRVALGTARRPPVRAWPLATVLGRDERPDTAALRGILDADQRYLATVPGERFTAVWRPDPGEPGSAHTYLLVSQGYYTEWMRQSWLTQPSDTTLFRPSNAALATALQRWRAERGTFERQFNRSRLPVR